MPTRRPVAALAFLLAAAGSVMAQDVQPVPNDRVAPKAEPALEKRQAPGTKVFLALPNGFRASNSFAGFENDRGDNISIVVVPGAWQEMAEQFSAETIGRGGRVLVHEAVEVQGKPGFRIETAISRGETDFQVLALAFGDEQKTVVVSASAADADEPRLQALRAALGSVEWRESATVDALAGLPFTIDLPAGYRSVGPGGAVAAFTDRPSGEPEPEGDAFLVMTARAIEVPEDKRAALVLDRLTRGGTVVFRNSVEATPVEINGLAGYESLGRTETDLGTPIDRYSLALFDGAIVYEFTATAPTGSGKMNQLREIARSVKRKAQDAR